MRLAREFELEADARMALAQILGIMSDQAMSGDHARWDVGRLMELEARLGITLGVDDVGQGPDGMAYTEIASADLPWIDMVRWTSDFVSTELRQHWTDDEWLSIAAG